MQNRDWNVLIITSDQHNPKLMGCAGHPIIETPGIDRLAREGVRFTKAYAAYPKCCPTRQSFMTGLYPSEHGELNDHYCLNKKTRTWAHHFKDHGFTTACIGKMSTNHETFPYGYDFRFSALHISDDIKKTRELNPAVDDLEDRKIFESMTDDSGRGSRFSGKVAAGNGELEQDGIFLEEALKYLHEHQDKNFFLHVSFSKPHYAWTSPKEYYYRYHPDQIDLPIPYDSAAIEGHVAAEKRIRDTGWLANTEEQNRLCRARYYGCISWVDSHVEKLLNSLDEMGIANKTLVLYFADHGDMAGEKGLWLKSLLYDGSARIPLVMRLPGVIPAGIVSEQLINHVDLFPTIAGLLGMTSGLPDDMTGIDLSGAILKKEEGREYTFTMEGLVDEFTPPSQLMARSARWKLIRFQLDDGTRKHVLYDMVNDPEETRNVMNLPEYSEIVKQHQEALDRFTAGLKQPKLPLEPRVGPKMGWD